MLRERLVDNRLRPVRLHLQSLSSNWRVTIPTLHTAVFYSVSQLMVLLFLKHPSGTVQGRL